MKGKKNRAIIISFISGLILFIIWNSVSQPGVQDLEGNFKRVAFYRNENNTGPVERIYAVTVSDTLWEEMKKYGAFMPHTKYGTTKVFFFQESKPAPEKLLSGQNNFDQDYQVYCLGKYEKDAMGQVSFIPFPFLNR